VVKGGDWKPVRMIQQKKIKYFELNEVKESIEQARHNRLLSDFEKITWPYMDAPGESR
ncbi:MAG: hypothetical protein ACI88H_003157, partial [Cocleimonas sp.]